MQDSLDACLPCSYIHHLGVWLEPAALPQISRQLASLYIFHACPLHLHYSMLHQCPFQSAAGLTAIASNQSTLMQVAYAAVSTAIFLVYYLPDLNRWVRQQASFSPEAFCTSKQVIIGGSAPSMAEGGADSRRRQQQSELMQLI